MGRLTAFQTKIVGLNIAPVNVINAVPTVPFSFAVANGDLDGVENEFLASIAKTTSDETPYSLWPLLTEYVPAPTASTFTIESTSADDAAGGTGAQVALLFLLDANLDQPVSPLTVPLDGTTPVVIPGGEYLRHNRTLIVASGASGGNQGEIRIRETGGGTVQGFIPAPENGVPWNQSQQSFYAVPADRGFGITDVSITGFETGGGGTNITLGMNLFIKTRFSKDDPFIVQCLPLTDSNGLSVTSGFWLPEAAEFDITVVEQTDNQATIGFGARGFLFDIADRIVQSDSDI